MFNNPRGQEVSVSLFLLRPSDLQLFYEYKHSQLNTNVKEVRKSFNHFLPGREEFDIAV